MITSIYFYLKCLLDFKMFEMILASIIDPLHKLSSEAARNESFLTFYLYLVWITHQFSWLVYQCQVVSGGESQDEDGSGCGRNGTWWESNLSVSLYLFGRGSLHNCKILSHRTLTVFIPTTGGPHLPHQHCLHSHQEGAQCRVRDDPSDVYQHLSWEGCLL